MKRKYQPPQERLAGSLAISAFLCLTLFAVCGLTSYAYWDGISYVFRTHGKDYDLAAACRNLETTLITTEGVCEHCGNPHKREYGSVKDEYKYRPYFFGLVAPNANIGSAIMLSGTRPILDDYLLDNYKNENVTIEAIYIAMPEYEMWLKDEITVEEAIKSAKTSNIGYTGANAFGPTSGENIAEDNPTGYLFATIVPEMERSTLINVYYYHYVLIRVNRRGELIYLNNIKDTSTLLPSSEHERNKFILNIQYYSDLYNWSLPEKVTAMPENRSSQIEIKIAVIASLLFTLGMLAAAWISMKLRVARSRRSG